MMLEYFEYFGELFAFQSFFNFIARALQDIV